MEETRGGWVGGRVARDCCMVGGGVDGDGEEG